MENIHLLQLMHLSSSTFPTGIFSHSFGFENLYEERFVESREGFEQFLSGILESGSLVSDAAIVRFSYENPDNSEYYDEVATALKHTRELRNASQLTGKALKKTIVSMYPHMGGLFKGLPYNNYPVIYGAVCRELGIDLFQSISGYVFGTIQAYVQVGIKLIPLSQNVGQSILMDNYKRIDNMVENVMQLKEEDIVSFSPMQDIASMKHENQQYRMYIS